MADPFVAEIRIFTGNFAPKGWAFCNGQLMPISQNTALFSLLGTMYGGDGRSTFGLPDLQGRIPIHAGQGAGLSLYSNGELGGSEAVTLAEANMPVHDHVLRANSGAGETRTPSTSTALAASVSGKLYGPDPGEGGMVALHAKTMKSAGGGLPHNNLQPYLALNFIIALQGVFPSRF